MNQNFYKSNSSGFDQFQPPQYSDVHQPPEEISIEELKTMMQSYCEIMSQRREQEAILLQDEEKHEFTSSTTYTIHLTKSAIIITNPSEPTRRIYHNHDIFYDGDGDDDEELFTNEVKRIQQILERTSFDAITPDFPITDSLSMGDDHLSTIPKMESDELIKSCVKNLVPFLSESIDLSNIESECDVPVCDNFTTFSNFLFDADDDFSSSDNESFSDEDIHIILMSKLFSESSMMIYGEDIPILDVSFLHFYPPWTAQVWGIEIAPDYEASRARGFVLRSLELQSFA
ncbi:hypothetical protein Tco_0332287 [Tanacetum coccineum]